MAKIDILAPFILSFEGGWSDHPNDHGGKTNMGVTLTTWKSVGYDKDQDGDIDADDLRIITKEDVIERVMRPWYWNKLRANDIISQAVANIIVDWAWMSGTVNVAKRIQTLVGVKADGVFGPVTIEAINDANDYKLFFSILNLREKFYADIISRDPSQAKFKKGWLRRLYAIHYTELEDNKGNRIYF